MKYPKTVDSTTPWCGWLQIGYHHADTKIIEQVLQQCINKISLWAQKNGFKFSPPKCEAMHFHTLPGLHLSPAIMLNNHSIEYCNEVKFLGLICDTKLTWRKHIIMLKEKCIRVCRILCSNVRGLTGNLSDLTVASSQYDIVLCSETLVSDVRHVSEVLVPSFCRPVLCRGKMPRARGMAASVRDGYGAFCESKFECGCCEMLVFRVWGARQNLCVVFIATLTYCRWPDFWLFTSINGCREGWGCPCVESRWLKSIDSLLLI